MSEFSLSQALQMIERLIIVSTVVAVDRGAARAKVDWGDGAISDWLPVAQLGSEALKFWIPPTVGTQVIVLSPGGDTTRGMIIGGPFSGAPPEGNFEGNVSGLGDVTVNDGDISVTDGDVQVDAGDVRLSQGSLTLDNGDVDASGVSLNDHVHSGVEPGPSNTGVPVN